MGEMRKESVGEILTFNSGCGLNRLLAGSTAESVGWYDRFCGEEYVHQWAEKTHSQRQCQAGSMLAVATAAERSTISCCDLEGNRHMRR
jgi:hypothetical protein